MVVDDLSTGDRANLDRQADFSIADVADLSALQRGIGSRRIDAVVHCAAKTKVGESMTKKDLYERVIVGGTRNVVQTSRRLGASIFVNISTGGAIYGEKPVCADEAVAVHPQSRDGARVRADLGARAAGRRARGTGPARRGPARLRRSRESGPRGTLAAEDGARRGPAADGSSRRCFVVIAA